MTADNLETQGRYIPAEIKRQVLLESGHACAIPGCQCSAIEFAHIEPYAKVKRHEVSNIVALCPNHHHAFDQKKSIDRKAMKAYKLKLQLLNSRYTKYELRVLAILDKKLAVPVSGEIEVLGLLSDGLIQNAHTLSTQSLTMSNSQTGEKIWEESFVRDFTATLTKRGREFIDVWKSNSEALLDG